MEEPTESTTGIEPSDSAASIEPAESSTGVEPIESTTGVINDEPIEIQPSPPTTANEGTETAKNNNVGKATAKKRVSGKNGEAEPEISVPPQEWFDEMYPPSEFLNWRDEDTKSRKNREASRTPRPRSPSPKLIITHPVPKAKQPEVFTLSDDEDEGKTTPEEVETEDGNGDDDLQLIGEVNKAPKPQPAAAISAEKNNTSKEVATTISAAEEKKIQAEMLKIMLTRAQLHQMADSPHFRQAVIGCYVRIIPPGLPKKFEKDNLIIIDQIVDVVEAYTYQHIWFNRRFRLRNFGDLELTQIHEMSLENADGLRSWFTYLEVKGESLPSLEFIRKKREEIDIAKWEAENQVEPLKVEIKRADLAKIALNPDTLQNLAKLDFDRFRQIVVGCFVCLKVIRKDMLEDCQYHIVPVADCVRGPKVYKVAGGVARVDYLLVFPNYGKYRISWLSDSFSMVTDAGFRQWIIDMRTWKQPIPTLENIREKAVDLQMGLNEAQNLPTYAQKKAKQKEEEERASRANLPIATSTDLNECLLLKEKLQSMAATFLNSTEKHKEDFDLLEKTMSGCFVRVKIAGSQNQYQIDQIRFIELIDQKPDVQSLKGSTATSQGMAERISVELMFTGAIRFKELINNSSTFRAGQAEFKEWLKKMHEQMEHPIPTYGFVDKKATEIADALEEIKKREKEQQPKETGESASKPASTNNNSDGSVANSQRNNQKRSFPPPAQYDAPKRNRPNFGGQYRARTEVRETPGLRPGYSNENGQSIRNFTGQSRSDDIASWRPRKPVPLVQRVQSDSDHINFVRGQEQWRQSAQTSSSTSSYGIRRSRYDQYSGNNALSVSDDRRRSNPIHPSSLALAATHHMEQALGFRHDDQGQLHQPAWPSSSSLAIGAPLSIAASSGSIDLLRRAMMSPLQSARPSSSFGASGGSGIGGGASFSSYYNNTSSSSASGAVPGRYSSSIFGTSSASLAATRRLAAGRQYSPEPPPVQFF